MAEKEKVYSLPVPPLIPGCVYETKDALCGDGKKLRRQIFYVAGHVFWQSVHANEYNIIYLNEDGTPSGADDEIMYPYEFYTVSEIEVKEKADA